MSVYNPEYGWPLYPLQLGRSVKSPDRPLVAAHYGSYDYELFDGCGGLSSSVVDVARLCAMFSDRDANPLMPKETIDAFCDAAVAATQGLTGTNPHGYHGLDWAEVIDKPNHVYRFSKGGWLPGLGSYFECTTGGFSYAAAQNGDAIKGSSANWLNLIRPIVEAHAWGTADLFPQFGMASLAPAPQMAAAIAPADPLALSRTLGRVQRSMAAGSQVRLQALPGGHGRVADVAAGRDGRG
jgi:hypothetical protein